MKIYIVRHGQTEWNVEGRIQGFKDSSLTQKGIEMAKNVQKRFRNTTFSRVYSSPLKRAFDTACIVTDNLEPIFCIDGLKEMNFGELEGNRKEDLQGTMRKEFENIWSKPLEYSPICGEDFEEFIHRIKEAFKMIIQECDGENILVVTHTFAIKAILMIFQNRELKDFWNSPRIEECSVTTMSVHEGKIYFESIADRSHL